MNFKKLDKKNNSYFINSKKPFADTYFLSHENTTKAKEFAKKMTYEKEGEHRKYRSGGSHVRSDREIYSNTLAGKISEFALFEYLNKKEILVEEPDVETYALGVWDTFDFQIFNKHLSVKSTKHFGNLVLLETKDWSEDGKYLPNIDKDNYIYDFHILIRTKPNNDRWEFDIPGFITNQDLKEVIKQKLILPKSSLLNGKVRMDAENYYIQSGELRKIDELVNLLKNIN